ncbi:hypothetical protein RHS01_09243 [Rhizoctonia solani]|uniref:F-box domain-containing protein n=1 Tax=Rhizoctonia solani TaxID=456999 RepID=A0A8H7I4H6_9AGAM|nr:hypothetical protein RHS01_09243 [Rhizoctonia solani]
MDKDNQRNASEGQKQRQPSKRARTNEPKKRIKGRQGGLQGIMKMPIEIFMEIAPYVNPGDLIALIRTNKFFRAMLLTRSAALIWQCALSNVPGLPPCPSGMVEPQYAALIFTKNCTASRLEFESKKSQTRTYKCDSARPAGKQNFKNSKSYIRAIKQSFLTRIKRFGRWHSKNPVYQLRAHKEYERVRDEYTRNGDKKGLSEWERQQQTAWNIRREEGDKLLSYINSTAVSRSDELRDLKTERRERIFERLRALGWDDKYFVFWRGSCSARKQWRALLEVSNLSLNEVRWTNMLPKLTLLLEENRPVIDEHEREGRRTDRRSRVATLLRKFNASTNPYQPIIDELQNSSASLASSERTNNKPRLDPPFPGDSVVGEWDFIISLCEEENSLDILEGLFNAHKDTISRNCLNGELKGKSDATNHLSDNTRFLLRADTIFMQSRPTPCYNDAGEEYGAVINNVHFPDMYQIQNVPYLYKTFLEPENIVEDLESYVRHEGKETIARTLLKVLEMPDAAYIELKYMERCLSAEGAPMVRLWNGLES